MPESCMLFHIDSRVRQEGSLRTFGVFQTADDIVVHDVRRRSEENDDKHVYSLLLQIYQSSLSSLNTLDLKTTNDLRPC